MLSFASQAQMAGLNDRYYAGRWDYYEAAAGFCRLIPHWTSSPASDVLEIGPYRLPLVVGCDTLDNQDHGLKLTYEHDATKTPWPIASRRYRLLVGLQVWEHLDGRQRAAWREARRVADWAVLSLPYLWPPGAGDADHVGISLDTIRGWTEQDPDLFKIVASSISPHARIVCLYDLRTNP